MEKSARNWKFPIFFLFTLWILSAILPTLIQWIIGWFITESSQAQILFRNAWTQIGLHLVSFTIILWLIPQIYNHVNPKKEEEPHKTLSQILGLKNLTKNKRKYILIGVIWGSIFIVLREVIGYYMDFMCILTETNALTVFGYLVTGLISAGLIAVFEELFYRGFLQSQLKQSMSQMLAIIVLAFGYALGKTDFNWDWYMWGYFTTALVYGYLFATSNNLWLVIAWHTTWEFIPSVAANIWHYTYFETDYAFMLQTAINAVLIVGIFIRNIRNRIKEKKTEQIAPRSPTENSSFTAIIHKHQIIKGFMIVILVPLILVNIPLIGSINQNNYAIPSNFDTPSTSTTFGSTTKINAETLDRSLVAWQNPDGSLFFSWRLLESDPDDITFNLYANNLTHSNIKLNTNPIELTTDYQLSLPQASNWNANTSSFYLETLSEGETLGQTGTTYALNPSALPYVSIDLQGDYEAGKLGIGDLDGDGQYDFVLKTPNEGTDPANGYWIPATGTHKLEAYSSNGTYLWTYDMGWDIEMGTWYAPYVVYDLDLDGKAEVIVKSGDGDHRDLDGRVASGPEYAKVLNGTTGEEITRAPWIPRWFGTYKNLARNQIGIAYLDGIHPFLIVSRGTYGIMNVKAYSYQNHELIEYWHWENSYEWGYHFYGEGAHTMTCFDVDADGKDEVILGSCVLDDDGNGLWATGFTHCDLAYVGDLDPTHPGYEIFYAIEGTGSISFEQGYGLCMVDAATGKMLWGLNTPTEHMHGGICSDFSADYEGAECYAKEKHDEDAYLLTSQGELIAREDEFSHGTDLRAIYWDGNIQRELFHGGQIWNYDSEEHYLDGIGGVPLGFMDIMGDWREELIMSVNGELRIYFSNISAEDRRVTLMQDDLYRQDAAHNAMGYLQVPMTSFAFTDPEAEKTPSTTWFKNQDVNVSWDTRIAAFYRKYHLVITSYGVSLVVVLLFVFRRFLSRWISYLSPIEAIRRRIAQSQQK